MGGALGVVIPVVCPSDLGGGVHVVMGLPGLRKHEGSKEDQYKDEEAPGRRVVVVVQEFNVVISGYHGWVIFPILCSLIKSSNGIQSNRSLFIGVMARTVAPPGRLFPWNSCSMICSSVWPWYLSASTWTWMRRLRWVICGGG